jgi:small GTP-binding protein
MLSFAGSGDVAVGKTAFILQACGKDIGGTHAATIGVDIMPTIVTLPSGKRVKLQCYDTAGQEQYRRSLTPVFVRNRDAYVLVYDVTRLESLRSLRDNWVPLLSNIVKPGAAFMLVGNKVDLLQSAPHSGSTAAAQERTGDESDDGSDALSSASFGSSASQELAAPIAAAPPASAEEQEQVQALTHELHAAMECGVVQHVRLSALTGLGVRSAITSLCSNVFKTKSQ